MTSKIQEALSNSDDTIRSVETELQKPLEAAESPEAALQATEAAAATPGCFLSGTKIMLSDGSYKNIEDIRVGEKVVAFDLVNNHAVDSDITTTFTRKSNSYRIIEYEIEN